MSGINEKDMVKLIRTPDKPKKCETCGAYAFEYLGLGKYKCNNCGCIARDNYGIVREYLDEHPNASAVEVLMCTPLTRDALQNLVDRGSIELVGGRIK